MKKWALHFLISAWALSIPVVNQAVTHRIPGARSAALSQATVAYPGAELLFGNPAAAAFEKRVSALVSYDSPFLVRELSLLAAGVVLPLKPGTFGLAYSQSGVASWCERKAALSYSMSLGRALAAGIQFDLIAQSLPENRDPCLMATIEGGMVATLSPRLHAGFHLFNPVRARLPTPWGHEKPLTTLRGGTCWHLTPELLLCTETEKHSDTPLRVKTGLEILIPGYAALRCGVASAPLTFSLGAGFLFRKTTFDIAFGYHGLLGFSPSAAFTWTL